METTRQIAAHFRQVFTGGNWTTVNVHDALAGITWQQAKTSIASLHSIAELSFHIHFFVAAVLKVFDGGPLDAHDRFSFDCPPIESAEDWNQLRNRITADAARLGEHIERMPQDKLWETFQEDKYGNTCRNLMGLIEHTHYHLGQIVIMRKLLDADAV